MTPRSLNNLMKPFLLFGILQVSLLSHWPADGKERDYIYIRPISRVCVDWLDFENGTALVRGEIKFPERKQIHVLSVERIGHFPAVSDESGKIHRVVCRSTASGIMLGSVMPIGAKLFRLDSGDEYGIKVSHVSGPGYDTVSELEDGYIAYPQAPFCVDEGDYLTVITLSGGSEGNTFSGEIVRKHDANPDSGEKRIVALRKMSVGSVMDMSNLRFQVVNVVVPNKELQLLGWVVLRPIGRVAIANETMPH